MHLHTRKHHSLVFLFILPSLPNPVINFSHVKLQTNLQLLARCYLQNNQAYSAYHILKGNIQWIFHGTICPFWWLATILVTSNHWFSYWDLSFFWLQLTHISVACLCIFLLLCPLLLEGTQKDQSRYLYAVSCFQMDLLNEAEAALCPSNEPNAAVYMRLFIQKTLMWLPICKVYFPPNN